MSPNEKPVFWANNVKLNEPEAVLKEHGWHQGSRPAASDFNWLFNTIQKDIHAAKSEIAALTEQLSANAAAIDKKLAELTTSTGKVKKTAEHALDHGHVNRKNGRVIIKNIKDIYWSLNDLVNELRRHNPNLRSQHWRFKDEFDLIEEEYGRPGDRK